MNDPDDAALKQELTLDEGRRATAYVDTVGKITVGIGHNLSDVPLPDDVIDHLYTYDMGQVFILLNLNYPWWADLPAPQARVLANLCFNMGPVKLAGFVHFLAAMQRQDWQAAAAELQDSLWFGQVGERGPRMIARLLGTADAA